MTAKDIAKDTRPWKKVTIGTPEDDRFAIVTVAHSDKNGKPDNRWPLGSAMNPERPGESQSSSAVERYVRKFSDPRSDNHD
jgi:hypothetical protein